MSHSASPSASTTNGTEGTGRWLYMAIPLLLAFVLVVGRYKYRDVCANIDGRQKEVPAGLKLAGDEKDQCVPILSPAPTSVAPPEFPTSGEGHAKAARPLKAWLNPLKTYTRPSAPVWYCFVEDLSLCFDDTEGYKVDRTPHRREWQEMPEGKYLVIPIEADDVYFRWYQ